MLNIPKSAEPRMRPAYWPQENRGRDAFSPSPYLVVARNWPHPWGLQTPSLSVITQMSFPMEHIHEKRRFCEKIILNSYR